MLYKDTYRKHHLYSPQIRLHLHHFSVGSNLCKKILFAITAKELMLDDSQMVRTHISIVPYYMSQISSIYHILYTVWHICF